MEKAPCTFLERNHMGQKTEPHGGKVDEEKRLSKYSAGTLPCRFGREMYFEICGQLQNNQNTTEAVFFVYLFSLFFGDLVGHLLDGSHLVLRKHQSQQFHKND